MPLERWTDVDRYIGEMLVPSDRALDEALEASAKAGLPEIQVTAPQGKFLHLLARAVGARRVLEVGLLGGYSTIWLARALPSEGRVVSLELSPKHAEVARANLVRAGVSGKVDIRVGPALDLLPGVEADGVGPFDLAFLDADKEHSREYVEWAVRLSRPGSVIVVDNVIRGGNVAHPSNDPSSEGVRRMNEWIARTKDVQATSLQTVGSKGYDGFTLVYVAEVP